MKFSPEANYNKEIGNSIFGNEGKNRFKWRKKFYLLIYLIKRWGAF